MTVGESSYDSVKSLPFANKPVAKHIEPIKFSLKKDGRLVTLIGINSPKQVPANLMKLIHQEFNFVVEEGLTYPHHETFSLSEFIPYWFSHFVAILVEGDFSDGILPDLLESEWIQRYLGDFYVKPNYIGRCSHVCNAGFKVCSTKRGLGLGKEMGKKYLEIAPKLGFTYSVFNLVFETNTASVKIWDDLGFERIGYVKNVAVLRGHEELIGAIMFGRDLV